MGSFGLLDLTGRRGFRAKFQKRHDIDPQCPNCGMTTKHVIISCTTYEPLRTKLRREIVLYVLTEQDCQQVVTEDNSYYKGICVHVEKHLLVLPISILGKVDLPQEGHQKTGNNTGNSPFDRINNYRKKNYTEQETILEDN